MKEERSLPTSEEVDRRLRIVSELRNLCLSLGRARPVELPTPAGSVTLPKIEEQDCRLGVEESRGREFDRTA